jgi:hypothetical protein
MTEYDEFVAARMAAGDDANQIAGSIESAIARTGDWELWGDGEWRKNFVCARCGSAYPGICGTPSGSKSISEFKGCTDEKPILYKEWLRRQKACESATDEDVS